MKKLFLAMCLTLVPSGVFAQTNPNDLPDDKRQQLVGYQNTLKTVNELHDKGLLDKQEVHRCWTYYLNAAEQITGRYFVAAEHDGKHLSCPEFDNYLTASNKSGGLGVFLTTLIVLAGIIFLLALCALGGLYLWPLLIQIPVVAYEVAAYVATALLLLGGFLWRPFDLWFLRIHPLWFVVPGALAFPACITLSRWLHGNAKSQEPKAYFGPNFLSFRITTAGLSALVWGGVAVAYHQLFPDAGIPWFLAFISVMALESFLGFSTITTPGCVMMGWEEDAAVPRSTSASFLLLAGYCVIKLTGSNAPEWLTLFGPGCLFMGAFVYFLGLLVMSSKWYSWRMREGKAVFMTANYLYMQFFILVSGFAALYLGSTYGISALLGVGGTFFALYLLEKYCEIPWGGVVGWAWSLLGVAVGMYFFIGFASQNPQYFVWGIR